MFILHLCKPQGVLQWLGGYEEPDLFFPCWGAVPDCDGELLGLVLGRSRVSFSASLLCHLIRLGLLGLRVCARFSCHGKSHCSGEERIEQEKTQSQSTVYEMIACHFKSLSRDEHHSGANAGMPK